MAATRKLFTAGYEAKGHTRYILGGAEPPKLDNKGGLEPPSPPRSAATDCSDECTDVNLLQLGHKCKSAALFSLMKQIHAIYNSFTFQQLSMSMRVAKALAATAKLQNVYVFSTGF